MRDSIYIHVWKDDDNKNAVFQHKLVHTIEGAVDEYWQEEGLSDYVRTYVLRPDGSYDDLDIEDYIQEQELDIDRQCREEEKHKKELYSWYRSTRL